MGCVGNSSNRRCMHLQSERDCTNSICMGGISGKSICCSKRILKQDYRLQCWTSSQRADRLDKCAVDSWMHEWKIRAVSHYELCIILKCVWWERLNLNQKLIFQPNNDLKHYQTHQRMAQTRRNSEMWTSLVKALIWIPFKCCAVFERGSSFKKIYKHFAWRSGQASEAKGVLAFCTIHL